MRALPPTSLSGAVASIRWELKSEIFILVTNGQLLQQLFQCLKLMLLERLAWCLFSVSTAFLEFTPAELRESALRATSIWIPNFFFFSSLAFCFYFLCFFFVFCVSLWAICHPFWNEMAYKCIHTCIHKIYTDICERLIKHMHPSRSLVFKRVKGREWGENGIFQNIYASNLLVPSLPLFQGLR